MAKRLKYAITISLIAVVFVSFRVTDTKYFEIARNLDIFATLFKEVNAYYVDEIDPEEVVATGINAMLASLDPYTTYIPEEQLEEYRTMTTGQYGGIGASAGEVNGRIVVSMLYEGYAAQKAGLLIGDQILEIDGIKVNTGSFEDPTKLLKGNPGTEITLKVKRNNEETSREFTFYRELVEIPNVPHYELLEGGVGYIRLSDFTQGASKEVTTALKELKQQGATGIILDVRSNPGGLLSEAINVSNIFIDKGKEIVSTKGKVEEWNHSYKALGNAIDVEIPLAVLTNNVSASASEIVAGVIQDYDRGVLIGRRTYGKGLVQATRTLSYNSQLKVTTAKYYIPSGRCIQAIDYAIRNEDGSVNLIPDSLKVPFKTTNGRVVYDGGGLEPDLHVDYQNWSELSANILRSGLIFVYATDFYHKNPNLANPQHFTISDTNYSDFLTFLSDNGFEYESQLQRSISKLKVNMNESNFSEDVMSKVSNLQESLSASKKDELNTYKLEVRKLLEQEIISRYLLTKGSIQSALTGDEDLESARAILLNPEKYYQLLSN